MEREVCQLVGLGVDPPYGTGSLKAETGSVGEAHTKIVPVAGIDQLLHPIDGAAQVMGAEHTAILDLGYIAVITAMYAKVGVVMTQHMFETFVVESLQAVLRIVVAFALGAFDEIDHFRFRHPALLLQ